MSVLVLGIDPGQAGAVAILNPANSDLRVFDLPGHNIVTSTGKHRSELDIPTLIDTLKPLNKAHAFCEKVSARPRQGSVSMFRFGYASGVVHAALVATGVSLTFVTPQEWQRAAGVASNLPASAKRKDRHRQRASELFPQMAAMFRRVSDEHRADAALIAWYGARVLSSVPENPRRLALVGAHTQAFPR